MRDPNIDGLIQAGLAQASVQDRSRMMQANQAADMSLQLRVHLAGQIVAAGMSGFFTHRMDGDEGEEWKEPQDVSIPVDAMVSVAFVLTDAILARVGLPIVEVKTAQGAQP